MFYSIVYEARFFNSFFFSFRIFKWVYYEQRTKELFYTSEDTELVVLVGNHDVGFHYDMTNHKLNRFNKSFSTLNNLIELHESTHSANRKDIHFILVNSMALENDGCRFCAKAQQDLAKLTNRLNCIKAATDKQPIDETKCNRSDFANKVYSRPIVLSHFPLYRISDEVCPQDADSELTQTGSNPTFRSKHDCLSHESTKQVEFLSKNPKFRINNDLDFAIFFSAYRLAQSSLGFQRSHSLLVSKRGLRHARVHVGLIQLAEYQNTELSFGKICRKKTNPGNFCQVSAQVSSRKLIVTVFDLK
jgi:hypothetical protein